MFLITNINDKTFWEKKDLKVTAKWTRVRSIRVTLLQYSTCVNILSPVSGG